MAHEMAGQNGVEPSNFANNPETLSEGVLLTSKHHVGPL